MPKTMNLQNTFFKLVFIISLLSVSLDSNLIVAQINDKHLSFVPIDKSFALVSDTDKVPPLMVDDSDYEGVFTVVGWFVNDLKMVSGHEAMTNQSQLPKSNQVVLVGTIGKNLWIHQLIKAVKIDASDMIGQRERILTQVVENPFPGENQVLVFAGNN